MTKEIIAVLPASPPEHIAVFIMVVLALVYTFVLPRWARRLGRSFRRWRWRFFRVLDLILRWA